MAGLTMHGDNVPDPEYGDAGFRLDESPEILASATITGV